MKSLLFLFLAFAPFILPAAAQDEKKLSPAERFLKLTRFEETGIEAAKAAFQPFVKQFADQGYPPEAIKEIEAASGAYFHQLMTDADLQKEVVDLYNATFSEDELEEMLAFYETPTGRKALTQMPKIMGSSMTLGEKYAQTYAPAFQEQMEKIVAKYQDQLGDVPEEDAPEKE